jgi:S-adenosylmethionine/arginine decarboxylase-like enzyme
MILKHEHLLVRAELSEAVRDTAAVEAWLSNLITAIEMQTLKGPFSIYSTMPGNTGVTAGAILSTSHIMLHTFEDDDYTLLQLDVYSCSNIDVSKVMKNIESFFNPYKADYKFLDREHEFKDLIIKAP